MNNYTLRAIAVALVLSIAAFPQLSIADTTAYAESSLSGSVQSDTNTGASGQVVGASAFVSDNVGPWTGQSAGNATAAEGSLRAWASSSARTDPWSTSNGSSSARGRASWNDSLMIGVGGGLTGHSGYITAELNLSGIWGGNVPVNLDPYVEGATATIGVNLWGTGMTQYCGFYSYCVTRQFVTQGLPHDRGGALPPVITVNIPVLFGSPTELGYTLEVTADTNVVSRVVAGHVTQGAWAESIVDYSHTLSWGGITGVFDASGNAVSNFTVTSASGFEYAAVAPVPEPETYAMLLAGLGLLGFAARRRKLKAAAAA